MLIQNSALSYQDHVRYNKEKQWSRISNLASLLFYVIQLYKNVFDYSASCSLNQPSSMRKE